MWRSLLHHDVRVAALITRVAHVHTVAQTAEANYLVVMERYPKASAGEVMGYGLRVACIVCVGQSVHEEESLIAES